MGKDLEIELLFSSILTNFSAPKTPTLPGL